MKKTISALFILLGAMYYSQSSIFVLNNQNPHFDAVGRFFAANITGNPVAMYASPNSSYGAYTIPAGVYHKYGSFDTSGGLGNIMDIDTWNVSDYLNPGNSGPYAYNDPFITFNMNPNNEWAGFIFWLQDISTGNTYDYFQVGNPAVASNIGAVVNSSQTGATTSVYSDWYTITSGPDQITFFTIYP